MLGLMDRMLLGLALLVGMAAFPSQAAVTPLPGVASQQTRILTAFPHPLAVQVTDASGHPAAGAKVDFQGASSSDPRQALDGIAGHEPVTADANGIATYSTPLWSTGVSTFTVHVASDFGSADITLDVVAGARPDRIVEVSGLHQSVPGGTTLTTPFRVRVFDSDNQPMPRAMVFFTQLVSSTATAGGFFATALGKSTANDWVAADDTGVASGGTNFTTSILQGTATISALCFSAPSVQLDFPLQVTAPALGVPSSFQDMWWAGDAENGWGMSVIEHDHTMFLVIFAYDAAGDPTWYVVPDAHWQFGAGVALSGTLYSPTATPFFAFQPGSMNAGASVGTIGFFFNGPSTASVSITLSNDPTTGKTLSLHKALRRMAYAPVPAQNDHALSDMWWGGAAQTGWGVSVLEQAGAVFSVWYTYRDDGKPTWFVMPGGMWTTLNEYAGSVYSTTNPTWHSSSYDPAQLIVTTAGSYRLHADVPSSAMRLDYSIGAHAGTLQLQRQPF
jgi:hypothetical protein